VAVGQRLSPAYLATPYMFHRGAQLIRRPWSRGRQEYAAEKALARAPAFAQGYGGPRLRQDPPSRWPLIPSPALHPRGQPHDDEPDWPPAMAS